MAQIGTLRNKPDGGYSFTLRLLIGTVKGDLVPNETKKGANSPDYRIFTDERAEIGAAWEKQKDGRAYVSLSIDDPCLPQPLQANSFEREDGKTILLWKR